MTAASQFPENLMANMLSDKLDFGEATLQILARRSSFPSSRKTTRVPRNSEATVLQLTVRIRNQKIRQYFDVVEMINSGYSTKNTQ